MSKRKEPQVTTEAAEATCIYHHIHIFLKGNFPVFLFFLLPWSVADFVVFAFLAFCLHIFVILFSWLVGRLASRFCRLFGRLVSCFFSHANEFIHEDISLIRIVIICFLVFWFL